MSIERNFNKYLFNLVKALAMDNKVAKTVALTYQRLRRDKKESFFESLMAEYANYSDDSFNNIRFEETSKADSIPENQDFRLKSVRLANVRGIPDQKNSAKYGIDLFDNGQIQNAVFLGPNGTGKSSLFDAIEFIYAHEVAEKKLRVRNPDSLNENDFLKYLEHFNETPECEIMTPAGKFSLRNRVFKTEEELKTIYPDTHFISDYDIYDKGQLNYLGKNDDTDSFHQLIANSLGLQEYLDFANLLKSISTYRRAKESNERNKLIINRNNLSEEIRKNQEQIQIKSEQIKTLKANNEDSIRESSRERLSSMITLIKHDNYYIPLDNQQYQRVFEKYRAAQEVFKGLSVNQNLQTEAQFLSLGLELINHSENCPFCENSNSSISDIKKKVERRILEIKEFEMASKNLEASINNIRDIIKDVLTSMQSTGRTLKLEIDKITAIPELIEVHKTGKDLIDLLADEVKSLMSIDETIYKASSSNDILAKKNDIISSIIKENELTLSIEIPNTFSAVKKFVARRKQVISEIEASIEAQGNVVTPKQQIPILESEIKSHQSTININGQQIKALEKDIERLTKTLDTISEIKIQAGEFAKILDFEVNKLVASSFEPIKETISSILSDYLKDENVEMEIRLDKNTEPDDPESFITTIVAEIKRTNTDTGEIEIHSPSKYFNTFRFRLFCTMVNISVVIAARNNTGINLPLVLDDVFYASDYNSKITFKQFILSVLSIFRKFNSEMPLQFILFTHDELVFDSAMDAVAEFESQKEKALEPPRDNEWQTPIHNKTMFARLFSANEVDPTVTQSDFGEYWDLSYRLPTQLEHLLNIS